MNSYLKTYLMGMKCNVVDPNTDRVIPRAPFQMEYVVCRKYGEKIGCVRKAYKRLLMKLGIQNACLHTLRHTFASMCIMNNVDLYTIKEFLGHSLASSNKNLCGKYAVNLLTPKVKSLRSLWIRA
jgi:integrase